VGQKYLAVLAEENDDEEAWLYVPVSPRRFEMVRSGGIDLHTAFGNSETGYAYSVHIKSDSEKVKLTPIENSRINPKWLPRPETKLGLQTETLPQKVKNRAVSSMREIVGLRLNFPRYTRSEAPVLPLGEILVGFQETLNNILDTPAWMRVVGFAPGSFEVEMEAEEHPNLFNSTNTGYAIKILIELIESAEDPDTVTEKLKKLRPEAVKSFSNFAKSLSGDIESAEITWESPNPEDGGRATLKPSQALAIYQTINEKPTPETRHLSIKGTLRGLDLKTKHFRVAKNTGTEYFGYVAQESIIDPVIQNAQINQMYIALIEEAIYRQLTDPNPKPQYTLIKLDHIPDDEKDEETMKFG
jgi:hypothetical protein